MPARARSNIRRLFLSNIRRLFLSLPRLRLLGGFALMLLSGLLTACTSDEAREAMNEISKAAFSISPKTNQLWREEINRQLAKKVRIRPSAQVTECDTLAADPLDPNKVATGVVYKQLRTKRAIRACSFAVDVYPHIDRFRYQLARALARGGHSDQALTLFKELAEKDYALAQETLGVIYLSRGRQGGFDLRPAVRWLEKAADNGAPNSQWMVGGFYSEGRVVDPDAEKAVKYIKKAAQKGHSRAQTILAKYYLQGVGETIEKDVDLGTHWLKKAAELHEPEAQYFLSLAYQRSVGVERNTTEALRWLNSAARWGHPLAQAGLGLQYLGMGDLPEDYNRAYFWLTLARNSKVQPAYALREVARESLAPGMQNRLDRLVAAWTPPRNPDFDGVIPSRGTDPDADTLPEDAATPDTDADTDEGDDKADSVSTEPAEQDSEQTDLPSESGKPDRDDSESPQPESEDAEEAADESDSYGGLSFFGVDVPFDPTPLEQD